MADQRYYNMNAKGEDNRYKVNTNILRMMQANPALGTGYIIGSMLGENYWGKKRAKSEREADARGRNGSVGADANGTYGTAKGPNYYNDMNKALEEYRNTPNGNVLYSGSGGGTSNPGVYIDTANGIYPRTPQQANKPAVTAENAGNGGGVPGVMDAWNNMNNASMYNAGNTAMYTNGARNLGNVIGADANGLIGVSPAAPSAANIPRSPQTKAPNLNPAPIPYTAEQLQQIRDYGGFTPEELRRAGAEAAIPQAPAPAPAQGSGGYVPTTTAQQPAPTPVTEIPDPSESYPMASQSGSDLTPSQVGILNQIAAAAAAEEEAQAAVANQAAAQPNKLAGYKSAIDWNEVRQARPTFNLPDLPTINIVDDRPKTWNEAFARRANQPISLPQVNIVDDRPRNWDEAFARRVRD